MTRDEYTDRLIDVLVDLFPEEQAFAQLSADDIAATIDALARTSNEVLATLKEDE